MTEASVVELVRRTLSRLRLVARHWKDLGPGHGVVELQEDQVDVAAESWRALLTAPGETRAVVAMAPGFVIAFLGVALGPLGSVQEKLHNISVILH